MLRVAICDADERYRKQTANILFHTLFDVEDVCFTFYETGEQLLQDIAGDNFQQDLLITDLILPGSNGLRILEFLRKQGFETDIIVQTEAVELALHGYRLHVFDFISKPVSIPSAEQVFNRYAYERLQTVSEYLEISIQGCRQRLPLRKIQFFESRVRKIAAVMENSVVEFYQKMDALWEKLPQDNFLRCHQSYIVNKSYIMGMAAGELVLFNQKTVPISRRYARAVREAMEDKKS